MTGLSRGTCSDIGAPHGNLVVGENLMLFHEASWLVAGHLLMGGSNLENK